MAAVVLSTAADHALNKAVWPTVGSGAAWCVIEGLKWAVKEFHAAGEYPQELQELMDMLAADSLQQTASLLDSVTDHPSFSAWRDDYTRLCDALEDAVLEFKQWRLMGRKRCLAAEPVGGLILQMTQLFRRAMHRDIPHHLKETLQHFVCFENFARLREAVNEIQQSQAQGAPRVVNRCQYTTPPLRQARGPMATDISSPPPPPAHIFQHQDDLVPRVHELMSKTRHVGIFGMAGIGKTTVARAVFERAKERFPGSAVWLTVGKEAPKASAGWALNLLRDAFAQLFPRNAPPFKDAQEALNDLAHRLRNRRVLLVLDDVWLDEKHAVVASLNFATDPQSSHDDSRLIITTRERGTLSDNPNVKPATEMDELEVVEPPPLSDKHAKQLFEHHALDPGSQRPELNPQEESLLQNMLKECGGNPLALQVLGEAVKRRPANGWEQSLKEFRELRIKLKDAASAACSVSVEALPPSLQECFIDFAAFQEDARVEEGELVQLFATHAPLHTRHSVRAAKFKLKELVQRSLVSVERRRTHRVWGTPLYYMHDVLHSLARSRAQLAEGLRQCSMRFFPWAN